MLTVLQQGEGGVQWTHSWPQSPCEPWCPSVGCTLLVSPIVPTAQNLCKANWLPLDSSSQASHCMRLVKPLWAAEAHAHSEILSPQHLWKPPSGKQLLKNQASLLHAQVYRFSVKGIRKYFSTYHTRTCGLFYDSRTSGICKAMSHRVVVQQSSSNIYL